MPNSFVNYANAEDLMTAIGNKFKLYKGAKIFKGSIQFSEIPQNLHEGDTYDITNDFTTDSRFVNGAGEKYPGGTDISVVNVGTEQSPVLKLDTSSGFIDVDAIEGTIDGMIDTFTDDVFDPTDPPHEGDVVQYEGHVYTITTDYPTPEPGQEVPWDPNKATPYKAVTKINDIKPEPATESDVNDWLNILNPVTPTTEYEWASKSWNGLSELYNDSIWTDGENIYYSDGDSTQYVLDKETDTWNDKTWEGFTDFYGNYIWTDGENIYYSNHSTQYVLDKTTSTWIPKTWNGISNFGGDYIWTDGENIYYSYYNKQYILDKTTSTWSPKTWSGISIYSNLYGDAIWTDGENIYYSSENDQYILNKTTGTWSPKTWYGFSYLSGNNIWTDGENIYYSDGDSTQYVLDKETDTWSAKTWEGFSDFYGNSTWTDGENIYYSDGDNQYMLVPVD